MEQKPLITSRRASRLFRTASFLGCILSTIFLVGSAASQDITNHAVPIGGGAGSVGWKAAGPCNASQALVWANVSSDPTCTTIQTPITPSALTKTDDTNVTLTLGGTPTTALLQATSLTLGWTGTLSVSRGGTGIGSGTSGGVPYFSASGTIASSGALTANLPVIGGGAGVAPSVGTRSGNTTQFVTTTGAQTSGNCVSIDANGNHIANGSACATTGIPTVQRFTTGSGTYTPTGGTSRIHVRMVAGGGGGGAQATNNGSAGGDTSLGSWTAKGGSGGPNGGANTVGGAGGTGGADGTGNRVIRYDGNAGGSSVVSASAMPTIGGPAAMIGNFGPTTITNSNGLQAPGNTGGGGSGGGATGTAFGGGGGGGEFVEFWVSSPGALSYSVGAAGTGATAGTRAGGNGGSGIIIIEEFP